MGRAHVLRVHGPCVHGVRAPESILMWSASGIARSWAFSIVEN